MENPLKMKHISLSLIAVALFLFGSCLENNKRLISVEDENVVPLHFYARIESQPDSTTTKSTLSGTSTDAIRKVLWEPSDSIYVTNGTSSSRFNNVFEENSDVADFSGKIALGTSYFAAFPYGIVSGFAASSFQLSLPTVQPYKVDGVGSESFPMVAQCVDNFFEFKNLCGILVLNLTGDARIDSIHFSGTNDLDKPIKISGKANVSATYVDVPSLAMDSTSFDYVVLNCIGTDGKGVALNSTTPTSFHIVLPAETYAHFTVIIYSSDRRKMTINSQKPLSIKRSKRTTASNIQYLIDSPEYEFIDMGLSVNWATFNVGSYYPEEYGDYYAWGEIKTKSVYDWSTYKYCNGTGKSFTKYCNDSNYGYNGFIDNKDTLDLEDDIAHMLWGGAWHMPSLGEYNELCNNCTRTEVTLNGVNGFLFTSNIPGFQDKSIFLPNAGYRRGTEVIDAGTALLYSAKTLDKQVVGLNDIFVLWSLSSSQYGWNGGRENGYSIRPVQNSDSWLDHITVSFENDNLELMKGDSYTLIPTIKYEGDTIYFDGIEWTNSDPSIATINTEGVVAASIVNCVSSGTTVITASVKGKTASCTITVTESQYEYVDLGLSVNWAAFNIGATIPEESGDYYAWGETETKDEYEWANYKWCKGSFDTQTKYCFNGEYGFNDYVDNKTLLEIEDDVAATLWGGEWRMPTMGEFRELLINCTWTWTTLNGVKGYKIRAKKEGYTDSFIFLPASGYFGSINETGSFGCYWSSTLDTSAPDGAFHLDFSSKNKQPSALDPRYMGMSIRAVTPSENWQNNFVVTLDNNQLSLNTTESFKITATTTNDNDTYNYFPIVWSTDDSSIAVVNENGVVTAISSGTTNIKASCHGKSAQCVVNVYTSSINSGHIYVDLGLSVNWATCNIGALSPEEFGDYYSWGETETYYASGGQLTNPVWKEGKTDGYTASSYMYCNGTSTTLTKYNTDSKMGTVDNKIELEDKDDVAQKMWSGNWYIPSVDQYIELINNCTWLWTSYNGVSGYKVISNKPGYTDRYIFIPAAKYRSSVYYMNDGYGCYSTRKLLYPTYANIMTFDSSNKGHISNQSRFDGFTVRAVCLSEKWLSNVSIILNTDSESIVVNNTYALTAIVKHNSDVLVHDVIWTSSNPSIATVTENGLVTGVAAGSTTITATCLGKTATCTITVAIPEPASLGKTTIHDINPTSVTLASTIVSNGDADIISLGFCYSTSPEPTISDNTVAANFYLAQFSAQATSLAQNTKYYVRSFATTQFATSYGEEASFTTTYNPVEFGEVTASDILLRSMSLTGSVTSDGGNDITERGYCLSKSENPSTSDIVVTIQGTTGAMTGSVSGLQYGSRYYVRPYAVNAIGTFYGSQSDFETITPPEGAAPGIFKVNVAGGGTVRTGYAFVAKGDLEYYDDTQIWSFAEHQYEATPGARSKFAWGTSGYNGIYPGKDNSSVTSVNNTEYDWGIHNPISNGGNIAGFWRTPDRFMLEYLLYSRGEEVFLSDKTVCGKNGFIILPDDWITPDGVDLSSSSFSELEWQEMEESGAIFIKQDRITINTSPSTNSYSPSADVNTTALWSSTDTYSSGTWAVAVFLPKVYREYPYPNNGGYYMPSSGTYRSLGLAVRLIHIL